MNKDHTASAQSLPPATSHSGGPLGHCPGTSWQPVLWMVQGSQPRRPRAAAWRIKGRSCCESHRYAGSTWAGRRYRAELVPLPIGGTAQVGSESPGLVPTVPADGGPGSAQGLVCHPPAPLKCDVLLDPSTDGCTCSAGCTRRVRGSHAQFSPNRTSCRQGPCLVPST